MEAAARGERSALDKLRSPHSGYSSRGMQPIIGKAVASGEKVLAREERARRQEERRAQADAERELRAANRDAAKQYKSDAIAFYTDAGGNVRPITAPSGAPMQKWGKSGTLFDPVTGKAYMRDDNGKLIEQDPDKDGKTVKKDGHVYKVVPGMKWKWAGYDKDAKTPQDRTFDADLAAKTRALKGELQEATGELSLLNKDIASDRARIRDLDRQINDAEKLSGDQAKVASLQGQKEQLEAGLTAKVERQAQAELNAYRERAEFKAGKAAIDADRTAYYDNKSKLTYDETKLPNTGRMAESTAGMANYISEVAASMIGIDEPQKIYPAARDVMSTLWDGINAGTERLAAASGANANAFADRFSSATAVNQWTQAAMKPRMQEATAQLSAQAEIKLPDAIRKATGVEFAPPSWFTPEAIERQTTAALAGQDRITAPPGYKLENGTLYALKETSSSFWGVPLPWSSKTTAEPIGKFKFDQYGVGYVELDPLANQSPSFASKDFYRGMPEYSALPKWFEDTAKPKMGSQVVAEVRAEVDAMDWKKAAQEMWDARRWSPEQTRDTLDQWQAANDRQRADLIAKIDPRQASLAPEDRRLDTGHLYRQGMLSAQDARLLNNTAYGTNPDFASIPSSFEQWAKNSPTAAAQEFRNAQSSLPKLNLWQSALATVAQIVPGAWQPAAMLMNTESARISAANTYAARDAFMSQYYQETARKSDFNMPAFVAARDAFVGDESALGWARNTLNSTLQNAFGSSVGVMVGAGKLMLDTVMGGRMLSDQERLLIGAQTQTAWQNMTRAAADRLPSSLGEALLMATPASYVFNLGGVRDKVWEGEKGGALNRAVGELYGYLNTGRDDAGTLKSLSEKVRAAGEAFHAGVNSRMSWENDPLDPRSTMNKAMAGYLETMSPAYWSMFKAGSLNSQYELEIQKMAAEYASQNGQISESSFFGPLQQAFHGGKVAPVTEMAIELASNLLGVGAAKALTLGKWLSTSQRAGLTLNRAGRAISALDNIEARFFDMGKVKPTFGVPLSAGQQMRNVAVDMAKMGWASGGGEAFEEVVAAFGEAGATFGDAVAQGLSGFIGGIGLSAVHAPIGAGLGSFQASRYAAAQDKALKQYVADYNTRYAETPISFEQAKQAQGYQHAGRVDSLNMRLKDLTGRDRDLAQELNRIPAMAGVAGPQGPMMGTNPRIAEILGERATIRGEIAATMLDIVGVSEGAIRATREIGGLFDDEQTLVDAAVRMVSLTPMTPMQEQALVQAGAYVRGDRVILPDAVIAQIKEIAPFTANIYFTKTETEQLAEANAMADGQTAVPQEAVEDEVQPPALPSQTVGQAPAQPQTQAPAPAPVQGGGSFTFEATYTPKGSQRPVTVTQTVQAATAEEAQAKAQTWATAIERRLSDGPVQLGPVQGSGDQTQAGFTPPAAADNSVFGAKPTAKTVTAMVEAAAPVLFNNPALPNVVVTPRLYVTRRMTNPITDEQYRALPPEEKKQYISMPNGGMAAIGVQVGRGPTIFIDQGQLAKTLANVPAAERPARIAAMAREEVLHLATTEVRGPQELENDWARLPDVVKRRVVEAYYPAQVLTDANQDWRNVQTDPQQMAMEFWRMYLSAKLDGVTTEQVAFAQDVDRLAEADPVFASNLRQLLENIAQWLRDNLLGTLDDQTRAEFEDVAAKIEAELARLEARGVAPAPVAESSVSQETAEAAAVDEAMPENRAFVPADDTGNWTSEALRAAVKNAAAAFGYKIVDTGIDVGAVDRYGNVVNFGTQMYDKFVPGSEVGQWIDKVGNSEFAGEIAEKMATPGLHRVWFGHDFLTNLDNVVDQFGWSAVPDFILQLLKDSLTKSGIPFPGVELLVRDGTVSDRVATDWLSTNIGEVFGGGVAFFGTYRLAQQARQGNLSRPRVVFATVGVGIKLAAGVATAQPFLIISGLADAAILVTNLDQVREAFKKGADMAKERPARPVVRPPQMVGPRVMPPQNPPALAPPVVAPEPVAQAPAEAVEAPQPAVAESIDTAPKRPRKRATKPKAVEAKSEDVSEDAPSELDAAFADLERFLKPAEVRGPDGLTDTERAALEAEMMADQEAEAAEAAGAGGIDILDAVREAGGLPAKASSKTYQYAGELQRIREAQRPGNAVGVKGTFNLFRNNAPDLDALIKDLQTMGFRDLSTPRDVFDLIERRLTGGRPIYGYEGMVLAAAAQPAGAEFIAAMTRVADALYAEGATTPEAMAARLVERFGNDMTPKLLSQVWANGTETDPDVQVSWKQIYEKAVDESGSAGNNQVGERIDRQPSEETGGEVAALQADAGQAGAEPADIQSGAGSGGLEDGRSAAGSPRDNERVLNKLTLDQQGREARIAEAFGDDWPDGFDALGVPNLPKGITDPADPRLQETSEKTTATIVAGSLANRVLGIPAGEISRRILRETIIEYFMRGGNDRKALSDVQEPQSQDNPLAVFMGGGGAAGKTSLLNREIAKGNIPDEGRVLANADEIREFLPEYDVLNNLNDARSSVITHEEASIIADEIERRARQNSFPLVIDGTMKNSSKALAKAEMLNEEGYRTKMIGVTIDPYEALVRSFLRGKNSQRYVPPDVLLGAHKGFNAALPAYIRFFGDDLVIYDNSPQNPILLSADDILSGRFSEVGARAGLNENAATPEELLGSYGEEGRIERPERSPQRVAAEGILPLLEEGRKLNFEKDIQPIADAAWGGTLAAGTYEIKDAYDAMELAVNLFLARGGVFDANQGWRSFGPVGAIRALEDLQERLPTQTKRSGRTDRYQQFSTPPVFSFVAHWVSGATAADVVLEPSAGIGGLAVYPKLDGATIIANELESKRQAFLREMGFDHLTTENAEQIDAILEPRFASGSLPRPTVVNMNPPFSNAAKSGKTGQTMVGAKHVESALKALRHGGRLVAIVGEGMGLDTPTFRQWWQNMAKQYHVRANIWVDGRNYTKYGTSFSNRLLVIDKVAPPAGSTNKNIIQGQVDDLADLITLLQGVRNDRPNIQPSAEQAGTGDDQSLESAPTAISDAGAGTGTGSRAGRSGGRTGGTGVRQGKASRSADGSGRVERGVSDGGLAGRGQSEGRGANDPQRTDGQRGDNGQPVIPGSGRESVEQTGITVEGAQSDARDIQNEDDVFATYKPAKVRIPGAQKHLAPLVESAAMASVSPPDPTYTPNLAKEVITEGRISETSLENIVYAGQAHAQVLPSGERRGYFIGDGTGVGKGRQIAGIIMDNLRQGRKKAVWISKSGGLIEDAKRDVQDVGLDPKKVFPLNKVKKGKRVEAADGILFTTYDTLKGGHQTLTEGAQDWWDKIKEHNSRMKQIAEWLGKDFDGVIALDEAHKAGNAIAVKGNRGLKQPSQAGVAVVDLQRLLPNARVVYVSATGATEVENLSYADRLGIWGEGTPFPNKQNFFDKIRAGGVSAMEVVARDLKAQGLYLARSISYKGVEFARLTHNLTPEQEQIYNRIATAWQSVLSNMGRIMDETGAVNSRYARSNAASAFWGAQQRFFNQLLTGLQLPALLEDMDQQLAAGNSAVLQLVNTGEAVEKRALAKARTEADGDEIPMEDLDLSPRQILLDFLEKSFPTALFEEVQDPDNPERTVWKPVLDSQGKEVQSPAALAAKESLMDEVALIDLPESPLNQIINRFGPDSVAEVTGRTQRVVTTRKNGKTETKIEKRGKAQARAEAQDFQDGKRRILIFSDAGGTGFSFHASNRAKNQQRRVHYLVQAGWRADNALQGFGRTHRTDQASAPIYRLLETNIKGHKRFIASIARRLAQLGALTTGERRTAGQGMFSDSDNLESPYSADALWRLMNDLYNERVEGFTFDEFSESLGYVTTREGQKVNKLVSQQGGLSDDQRPPITQFLNRILALPLDRQNALFDLFMDRLERRIETAKDDGSYDLGTQNYRAERVEVVSDDVVFTQPDTGATTRLVEIDAFEDQVFTTFEEAERGGAIMWVKNRRSGNVFALREGPPRTLDNGSVVPQWRRVGIVGNSLVQKADVTLQPGRMEGDKLVDAGNYQEVTRDEAATLWDSQIANAPKETKRKDHFLIGVMLPVWDRLGLEKTRIFRFTPTTGEPMLGVQVPAKDVPGLRMRMGARNTMTAEQAFDMVMTDGAKLNLANGWLIERRRVSGELRVEVSGLNYDQGRTFADQFGGIMERIQYTPRFFITDAEVMQRVMDRSPITQINGEDVNFSDNSPVVAGAARRLVTPEDMDADMDDQARWLLEQSRLRDYENTDELLAEEPETFLGLTAQWRETHPRAVGSPTQGAGSGGQSEDGRIEALVTDNLGLATALASRFNIPRIDFEDKVQEARIGLLTAAQSFDEGRGVPFGAYATRVIRNRLNNLYREQRRIAGAETRELDAPVGEMDGETGQSMLADRFENDPADDDLAAVREIMDDLPARPRRIWQGVMAGKTYDAIGAEEGISKQAVQQTMVATQNTLRAQLAKRGIRSVDDVFAQKDPFDTGRVEGMRQQLEDEEAKIAAARPSVEAELAQIAEERQKAQDFRKAAEQTPSSPLLPGAKEAYSTWLRGRMDKLEFYAPGAKAAMLDNRRNEALVAATINSMMQQIRDDITRAFGYPAFWSKNKKRLQNFLDELLPVAARLEVDRFDDNGDFVFKPFLMRSGTINAAKVRANKLKVGDMVATDRGLFELGPEIDGGRYLLLKAMPVEVQQQIYQDFHTRYPESAHYLDRWIMPGMQEARYMGPQGTMTAEFNRYALRDLFNEWPQELKDLFGGVPLPDLPYVEGYTPDVAEAKTLGAMIGSLLRSFRSGARKMKAGEARETGNIKNLFEGFSVRAMEAHREKIRVLTRQRLIEAAAVDGNRIPKDQASNYVELDQTYRKLLEAVKIARRLNPKAFPALTGALSPQDQKAMAKILGDAFRLRGRGLMIHKEVERELMLGISRQVTNNALTRILSGLLERYNAGLLATPFTVITNWASNEIIKLVRIANRFNYALVSIAAGDVNAAKLGGYELMYLMRGFILDRFPQWQQERIGKVVPRELFDDQTGLEAMDIDPNISVKQQLGRLNLGGAFMQAVGYGEIDIRQKQQMAYAAYRAHAQVAWNEAKRRGEVSDKNTNRREWQQNWIANAPADIHRDVYLTTVLYLMDYQNVPAWLDPQQSMTAMGQIVKRGLLPFVKWPYNMARQFKRLTFDAALNTVMAGRTKQQRIEGMANLMTMGALAAVGTAIAMADDDEDDPVLGASVDEEGNLLDAAFRTKNRINLSRLARIIFAHGLMRDAEFTLDDGSGESKDLWWRYRNYPYLKEGIAMGLLLAGKTDKALEQFADISEEYVSLGMLAKIVGLSSFDKDKPVGFRLGEVAYDVGTAGVLPTPWRQFATRMVDPVMRRTREAEPLGYAAGPLDAIRANTPFLSRAVPTTGQLSRNAFAPFSAEKWFSKEKQAVERSDMPADEKRATIESLRQQATKLNMTPAQQADFMRLAGLPVEQFNMRGTSTVPVVANLERLRSMGVGQEAYAVIETVDKLGRTSTQLVAPKASNIGYQPRGLQALRFFGGVNLMAVPRGRRELAK